MAADYYRIRSIAREESVRRIGRGAQALPGLVGGNVRTRRSCRFFQDGIRSRLCVCRSTSERSDWRTATSRIRPIPADSEEELWLFSFGVPCLLPQTRTT